MNIPPGYKLPNIIDIYRRVDRAAKHRQGIRLNYLEVMAVMRDGAITDALEAADVEDSEKSS